MIFSGNFQSFPALDCTHFGDFEVRHGNRTHTTVDFVPILAKSLGHHVSLAMGEALIVDL